MMPEGWEEALEMAERYRDYFSGRDADIALGRGGTHFFYVYDKEHGYFEVFHTFRTAAELWRPTFSDNIFAWGTAITGRRSVFRCKRRGDCPSDYG